MPKTIALLHPGAMGSSVGHAAVRGGHRVLWDPNGRSVASSKRASGAGFEPCGSFGELIETSDVVLSICPPKFATDVASRVADVGFSGRYVDANAISPQRAEQISSIVETRGAHYVDGGIIGPPATSAGTTRLYLSGSGAQEIATLFADSYLEAIDIGSATSAASALKMCYAAWTKGSSALLLAVAALAKKTDVEANLQQEWQRSLPDLGARLSKNVQMDAPKAWRFEGEMREIAATFAANDLPNGFHTAAADVFGRLVEHQFDCGESQLDEVLKSLTLPNTDDDP